MIKQITCLCIIFTCMFSTTVPHTGKEYVIISEETNTHCTLKTLSVPQMKRFIKNLASTPKDENPFEKAYENYMPVFVTIKHDGKNPIIIDKDDYLDGAEDFFVPKDLFAAKVYDYFLETQNQNRIMGAIMAPIYGLIGLGFSIVTFSMFMENEPEWLPILLTSIILDSAAALFGCIGYSSAKNYSQGKRNKERIVNHAWLNQRKKLPPDKQFYKILPGNTHHDLFFVDLKRASRKVFEQKNIKLLFEEQA